MSAFLGVTASGVALAAGLAVYLANPGSALSGTLLKIGLVLLMATPATRVLTHIAELARRKDWTFVAVTVVVLGELALAAWLASQRV